MANIVMKVTVKGQLWWCCFEKWKWDSFGQVANRISPGISRLRGVILYELQVDDDDQEDDYDDSHYDNHDDNIKVSISIGIT